MIGDLSRMEIDVGENLFLRVLFYLELYLFRNTNFIDFFFLIVENRKIYNWIHTSVVS